jgi:hypothetical protein
MKNYTYPMFSRFVAAVARLLAAKATAAPKEDGLPYTETTNTPQPPRKTILEIPSCLDREELERTISILCCAPVAPV